MNPERIRFNYYLKVRNELEKRFPEKTGWGWRQAFKLFEEVALLEMQKLNDEEQPGKDKK